MFPAPEKRRQLRQTALCREVENSKQHESFLKDFNQIQRNSQISLLKRQHTAQCRERDANNQRQQEEAKEAVKLKQLQEEQELAMQLHDANRRRINEEKLSQQLRESNQELRELESKLRA
ncbi:meiosis-specific nuclear structural protein 1-like [Armigeres subalbatus]|uniref:meiosis-specific nuclear structural protein 1-like n=1 Tax=Armigeres subalbatus TaxID=124917 RepID=UPI002ED06C6D